MSAVSVIGTIVKIFLLLTPFFVLSVFISSYGERELSFQRTLAVRVALAVIFITLVLYLFGELIFRYLGITLDAFRVGAGLVLLLNGIDMVRGNTAKNRRISGNDDPSVVPLAMPTVVGPGTIGAMLVMGAEARGMTTMLLESLAIAIAGALVGLMLFYAAAVERFLKTRGLSILSKLTGMYIVALAAQVIFDGVRGLLK